MIKDISSFSLADIGCGGGDIMKIMNDYSRKIGKNGSFIGIDANPHIIKYAKSNTSDYKEITYQSINIFSNEFRKKRFDIIHCCLFLHHFTKEELIALFKHFKKVAKIGVIINDLHRHPMAYWSIKILTFLLSKSKMVRNDAAISVARGFKKSELVEILNEANIHSYSLSWKWAFRWMLLF